MLFSFPVKFVLYLPWEKNAHKQKEAGFGPFFIKKNNYPFADFFDGRNSGALVMRSAPSEIDQHVIQDPLLQGLLVAVHVLRLASHELVRVVGGQFVDDGVGKRTEDQDGSGDMICETIYLINIYSDG